MNQTANVAPKPARSAGRSGARALYAEHLAAQPGICKACRNVTNVMQGLTVGLVALLFLKALVTSFNWANVNPVEIPFWWLTMAASSALFILFYGLDTIVQRAFVATFHATRERTATLVTGYKAVLIGLVIIAAGVAWGAANGALAYGALTKDMDLINRGANLLGTFLGAAITVALLTNIWRVLQERIEETNEYSA